MNSHPGDLATDVTLEVQKDRAQKLAAARRRLKTFRDKNVPTGTRDRKRSTGSVNVVNTVSPTCVVIAPDTAAPIATVARKECLIDGESAPVVTSFMTYGSPARLAPGTRLTSSGNRSRSSPGSSSSAHTLALTPAPPRSPPARSRPPRSRRESGSNVEALRPSKSQDHLRATSLAQQEGAKRNAVQVEGVRDGKVTVQGTVGGGRGRGAWDFEVGDQADPEHRQRGVQSDARESILVKRGGERQSRAIQTESLVSTGKVSRKGSPPAEPAVALIRQIPMQDARPSSFDSRRHVRTHSRSHSRQASISLTGTIERDLSSIVGLPLELSTRACRAAGENTPPARVAMTLNPGFTFGQSTAAAPEQGTASLGATGSMQSHGPASNRRARTHSRQISSVSGLASIASSRPHLFFTNDMPQLGNEQSVPAVHPGIISLRTDDSSASGSGSSSSGDSPIEPAFAFRTSGGSSDCPLREDADSARRDLESSAASPQDGSSPEPGTDLPRLSFGSDTALDGSINGDTTFSFPERHFDGGMRFGVTSSSPVLNVDTAKAVNLLTHQLVIPSFAIVPSTPMPEEAGVESFPFLATDDSLGRSSVAVADGKAALDVRERFGSFTFGKLPSNPPITTSVSSPVLGTRVDESAGPTLHGPRRHSHTRSSSVAGYAALSGTFGPDLVGTSLTNPRPGSSALSSSPDGAADEPTRDEVQKRALQSLEGKREGLQLSVDWTARSVDWDGRRNSWGAPRRKQRTSLTEKVEISLPSFDDEESMTATSLPITPTPASPGSPKRISRVSSAPSSPSRFSFPDGPQTSRRDSFGKIVSLVDTSPFGLAGLGITSGPAALASAVTPLRTLHEEEEEEEDAVVEEWPDFDEPGNTAGQTLAEDIAEANVTAHSIMASPPVAPASSKFRPLRLLSISTSANSPDLESVLHGRRRSASIDRISTIITDGVLGSPPPSRVVSDSATAARRDSIGRRPRAGSYSRPLVRQRFSGGSASSSATLAGSVKALHEVGADRDSLISVYPGDGIAGPELETAADDKLDRRNWNSTVEARLSLSSSTRQPEAVGLEVLGRALEAEAENQAMKEDIAGWQDRVKRLETALESERVHGRLLRDRIRKLGDHLSAISSMSAPPSSPPARSSSDTHRSNDSVGPKLSQLQSQLLVLTAAVDVERREKLHARAENEALREELLEERTKRITTITQTAASSPQADARQASARDDYNTMSSVSPDPCCGLEDPDASARPMSFGRPDLHQGSPLSPSLHSTEPGDASHPAPSMVALSFSLPPIPVLLNDDGKPVDIPSGPPSPEPDANATRIRAFAFPTGRIPRALTRPKSIVDPFFDLNMPLPDSASPVVRTFGKVFGRSPNPENDVGPAGVAALEGLPPIDAEHFHGVIYPGDYRAGWVGGQCGTRSQGPSAIDFSESCIGCSGPVFNL